MKKNVVKKRKSEDDGESISGRVFNAFSVRREDWKKEMEGKPVMIMLTKFNSKTNKKGEFVLNAEIIESIEETPDTVITLTNGKKLIVEEPMEEIVRRTVKYRRALYQN